MSERRDSNRDDLAELLQAVGKRPAPSREDYEQVLAATTAVWQGKVRRHRRQRWSYGLAATLALAAIGTAALLLDIRPPNRVR